MSDQRKIDLLLAALGILVLVMLLVAAQTEMLQ